MTRTGFGWGLATLVFVVACEQSSIGQSGAGGSEADAGEAAAGETFSGVPLGQSSWDVTLSVVPSNRQTSVPDLGCATLPQTLLLEPNSAGLRAVLGTYGFFITPRDRTARALGTFSAAELSSSKLGYRAPALDVTCEMMPVHLSEFSLLGVDADGDGVAERVEGSGSGKATYWYDDYEVSFDFEFALEGSPDQTRPRVFLDPAAAESNPFDTLQVDATEPLAADAQVRLIGNTEIDFDPAPSPANTNTVFTSEVIRPFSGSWTLEVDGHDQAGLTVASTITHSTLLDPGILATDGFEGATMLAFSGNSRVLDTINGLPALNGTRSLFVYPWDVVTLHLARPAGANHVRFSAQLLSEQPAPNVLPIVVGVIGGVERVYPREFPHVFQDTGSTFLRYVAPPEEVELLLTEPGEDVVMRIAPKTLSCSGAATDCFGNHGVLLDDLRIE